MTTITARGLHGQVVNELGSRIMKGELNPGDTIDPDALLREFGVSRTVMREVMKVLSAKGLIDARPRLGTYVTERTRWQLLDTEVMNWRAQGDPDPLLVLELGEVREIIEPAAARMAAMRRTEEQLATMGAAISALEIAFSTKTGSLVEADVRFHSAILQAAGNELLDRFEVVLEPALHARDSLSLSHATTGDFIAQHRSVFEAIAAQDAVTAGERMVELMHAAANDAITVLGRDQRGRAAVESRVKLTEI